MSTLDLYSIFYGLYSMIFLKLVHKEYLMCMGGGGREDER